MMLYDIRGRPVKRTIARYRIKWDKKSRSKFQFRVKQLLKPIWFADVVFEEFPVFGTLLKIDFYNGTKRIAVEVNGPQHEEFNPFFHDNSPQKFIKGIKRDLHKHAWCEQNKIQLIEIVAKDLENLSTFYGRIQRSSNS